MRHQVIQLKELQDSGIFKVSIQIPLEKGWIERVKFSVSTFNKKEAFQMNHVKNDDKYAYFEVKVELPTSAIYHYYFTFEANGRFQYYKKINLTGDTSLSKEECWKMSVGFNVPEWAKGAVMYHIFVDRYRRGKGTVKKIMPRRNLYRNWFEAPTIGPDENGEWNIDFYGGDIKGIDRHRLGG